MSAKENGLSPEALRELTQDLHQRRERLREDLRQKLLETGDKDYSAIAGQVHDTGDESIAELITSLSVKQLENEVQQIGDIESALKRLQENRYGLCSECGNPIPLARLRAYPTAKRCIVCQQRREDTRGGKDVTPSL